MVVLTGVCKSNLNKIQNFGGHVHAVAMFVCTSHSSVPFLVVHDLLKRQQLSFQTPRAFNKCTCSACLAFSAWLFLVNLPFVVG